MERRLTLFISRNEEGGVRNTGINRLTERSLNLVDVDLGREGEEHDGDGRHDIEGPAEGNDRVELVEGELSDAQDDGCDHDVGHTDDTSEGGELEAIHGSQAGERTHEESPEDDGQGDLVVQPGGEDVKGDNVGEDITNGNDITRSEAGRGGRTR